MFLYQLFFRLSREKRLPFYSPNHLEPTDHLLTADVDHDFCFGPARHFYLDSPELDESVTTSRLFQVRDPRDILCSEYYSFGWIHTDRDFTKTAAQTREQIQKMSIDEFILDENGSAIRLAKRLRPIPRSVSNPIVTLVRYEEMVSDFGSWLNKVLDVFDFGSLQKKFLHAKYSLMYRNEFKPDTSPNSHKRNVQPGEHRLRLKAETIQHLNRLFEPYLEILGYADDQNNVAA